MDTNIYCIIIVVEATLESSEYTAAEGDEVSVCVKITQVPSGGTQRNINFTLTPSDDSAIEGLDMT